MSEVSSSVPRQGVSLECSAQPSNREHPKVCEKMAGNNFPGHVVATSNSIFSGTTLVNDWV